jgi:Zn finger protein HypA/HybF involved in hydrogenase expression
MHESHLVSDLIARVDAGRESDVEKVGRIVLRVGALASVSPDSLKTGIEMRAATAWGYVPEVVIEASTDIRDPGAIGVTLVSIRLED